VLKRIFRLTDNKDFQTVYRRGRYNATALFSVNALPNRIGKTKIGIVVNKKVTKKASERNAIKRKVREIVRHDLSRLNKGQSVIITARQPVMNADYTMMKKDILSSFKKLELFKDENITKDN
jgi:ribonuclease P protein component